jgi:hypothetical protein
MIALKLLILILGLYLCALVLGTVFSWIFAIAFFLIRIVVFIVVSFIVLHFFLKLLFRINLFQLLFRNKRFF